MKNIIIVPCIYCERERKTRATMSIDKAYPITVVTNVFNPMKQSFQPKPIQSYLCEEHYLEEGGVIEHEHN